MMAVLLLLLMVLMIVAYLHTKVQISYYSHSSHLVQQLNGM